MNIGDKVRIKGTTNGKIFVIEGISQDIEGNELIMSMVNYEDEDDYSDIGWYPEELELVEDNRTKLKFPPFKSYGLTKEQVEEIVEYYINWQQRHIAEMLKEAVDDNNLSMIRGYLEDLDTITIFKCRLDSFNYRLNEYTE